MRVNFTANASTQFQFLSEDQCKEIYLAALDVLRRTGLVIYHDEALEILKENGALVEGNRAYIPPFMVERARAAAPSRFTVYSREGDRSKNLEISPNRVNYGPSATATHTLDPRTGERRKSRRGDPGFKSISGSAGQPVYGRGGGDRHCDACCELCADYTFGILPPEDGTPEVQNRGRETRG